MEIPGSCHCRCVGKLSIPPGFKFNPTDGELVEFYLKRKSANQQMPYNDFMQTNVIKDVEFYAQSPDKLIEADLNNLCSEKAQYFFTKLNRKYENGNRPSRLAEDGYWKITGIVEPAEYNTDVIGYKRSLNFLRGTPKESIKTKWKMKEFVLKDPPKNVATKFDEWVLCKLYIKEDSKSKKKMKNNKKKEEEDQITGGEDAPDPPPHPLKQQQQQQLSQSEFNRDWCIYASVDMLPSSECNELLSSSECNELLSSSECDELLKIFNYFQFPPP